jgi:hypothetical protein
MNRKEEARSCAVEIENIRHYATSQKVMGLNPDEVIGFFN